MDKVLLTARYVEGDLNEQEYMEFEHNVQYDTELQEYVQYYKTMHLNLSGQLKDALFLSKFRTPKSSVTSATPYVAEKISYTIDHLWYFTLVLVFAIGLFIWKPWTPNLYNEFKISEQKVIDELNTAPYQDFNVAANYVNDKKYYEAKLLVSKLYMKNPEDLKLSYYYGIMLLENNCFETISTVLSPAFAANSAYKDDAAYIMALSYLRQGDQVGCEEWLTKITKGSTFYLQANELKAKLASQSV